MTSETSGNRGEEGRQGVCAQCGTRHGPDQLFCDTCGAVLHWTPAGAAGAAGDRGDDRAPRPAPAPPERGREPRPEREPAPGPKPEREPDPGAGAGTGTGAGTVGGGPDDAAGTVPLPRAADGANGPHEGGADVTAAGAGTESERARALLVPVADPQGPPDPPPSVAPVLPGRPAPARPEVRVPGAPEVTGGVACPWCGTPNQPDRHFCGRCAMPMTRGPENPARRPWWRRLLDHRNREAPWAGDRPRLRRQLGRILRWGAGAVVLALVVTALFRVGDAVQGVRDHFAKRVLVAPNSVTASRSDAHHGPRLAFDEVSNTWWGPGVAQSGAGQWLEARFQEPVRLLDIGITPGESTHADTLSKSALPQRVEADVTMDDGRTVTTYLTLDQGSGFQHRSFRYKNVTRVRLTLRSAYGISGTKQVAIAEVEFFGPSHGGGG